MAHGLDDVETNTAAAPRLVPLIVFSAMIDDVVVIVIVRSRWSRRAYGSPTASRPLFLKFSTDWQDEMSVFLIVGRCSCRRQRCRRFRSRGDRTIVGFCRRA